MTGLLPALALLVSVALADDPTPPVRVAPDALTPRVQPLPAYPRALLGRSVPEVLTCEVAIVVEADGTPSSAHATGTTCLPEAAAEAEATALRWRWDPPRRSDGTVLRVETTLRLMFRQRGPATTPVATPTTTAEAACAVQARVGRDGSVQTVKAEPDACRPTTPTTTAPGREVPQDTVCRLALDVAFGRATRLRFEDCPVDAQPWAAGLTRGWTWGEGPTPRTVHLTLSVAEDRSSASTP